MKVEYSKAFVKAVRKLSGKKLAGYDFVYRIRIGSYRAFFTLHVHIENNVVMFEYLLPRGETYDKKNQEKLRCIDE